MAKYKAEPSLCHVLYSSTAAVLFCCSFCRQHLYLVSSVLCTRDTGLTQAIMCVCVCMCVYGEGIFCTVESNATVIFHRLQSVCWVLPTIPQHNFALSLRILAAIKETGWRLPPLTVLTRGAMRCKMPSLKGRPVPPCSLLADMTLALHMTFPIKKTYPLPLPTCEEPR